MTRSQIALLALLVAAVAPLCAAPKYWVDPYEKIERFYFGAKKGVWKDAKNWVQKKSPNGFVRVYIKSGSECTLDSACDLSDLLIVGDKPQLPATLSIERGARASLGAMHVPHHALTNSTGVAYMRGGEITTGNDREKLGALTVGAGQTYSGTGIFEISGGKINGNLVIGSPIGGTQVGTFSVVGGAPQIAANPKNAKRYLVINPSGTLRFVLDKDGAATLDFRGATVALNGGKLVVDGSAYEGGAKRVALILAAQLSENPRADIVGFDPKYKVEVFPEIKEKGESEALILKISLSKK